MDAVLLVGGLGTRLRPLTNQCPKPLVPIANVPFISRRLRYLGEQGVTQAILAVQYLADRFRASYGSGQWAWPQVRIVEEPQPLGTAGAAAYAIRQHASAEPVVVFNGDLLTDLDVRRMLAFHRRTGAVATIAVAEVADPRACGVVVADAQGRVSAFQEKPAPGSELANTVNTGVYILERQILSDLPSGAPRSFERELFPALLAQGLPVAAFRHEALWIDIGTREGYLAANAAVLEGRITNEPLLGREILPGVWAEEETRIDPSASLTGPIVLGQAVVVERGAQLRGPLVIGGGSRIAAGAQIEYSVLWEQVRVEADARISEAVLAGGAIVAAGEQLRAVARE